MKRIPYGRQHITKKDIEAVNKVLYADYITTGPISRKFEEELADRFGAKYAVLFNSGTSALHGAYFALDNEKGSEFITSPNTFIATGNAGLFLGLRPVFSDIEKDTGNINAALIEDKITPNTKFIVPVHYGGHPADLETISTLAKKHDLKIIEDASHAVGAKYKNSVIGDCTYSDMVTFSFHPVKHITTGEGGAVLTNNKSYYRKLQMFRNHGITKTDMLNSKEGDWYYEMHHLGHNYRMTDFQAALGISQLKRLDENIARRREIVEQYNQEFHDESFFSIPPEKDYAFSSYHLYPILVNRGNLRRYYFDKFHEKNIRVQVHYIPVYFHPYYQNLGYNKGICPVSEEFYYREISLPIYPSLTTNEQEYVIQIIKEIFHAG